MTISAEDMTIFSSSATSRDSCGAQLGNCWDATRTLRVSPTSIDVYIAARVKLDEFSQFVVRLFVGICEMCGISFP
jgi:hypothetical protein